MVDVGNKLIGQFADCLAGKLAGSGRSGRGCRRRRRRGERGRGHRWRFGRGRRQRCSRGRVDVAGHLDRHGGRRRRRSPRPPTPPPACRERWIARRGGRRGQADRPPQDRPGRRDRTDRPHGLGRPGGREAGEAHPGRRRPGRRRRRVPVLAAPPLGHVPRRFGRRRPGAHEHVPRDVRTGATSGRPPLVAALAPPAREHRVEGLQVRGQLPCGPVREPDLFEGHGEVRALVVDQREVQSGSRLGRPGPVSTAVGPLDSDASIRPMGATSGPEQRAAEGPAGSSRPASAPRRAIAGDRVRADHGCAAGSGCDPGGTATSVPSLRAGRVCQPATPALAGSTRSHRSRSSSSVRSSGSSQSSASGHIGRVAAPRSRATTVARHGPTVLEPAPGAPSGRCPLARDSVHCPVGAGVQCGQRPAPEGAVV